MSGSKVCIVGINWTKLTDTWVLTDSRSERKRLGAILLLTELMKRPDSRKIVDNHSLRALDDLWFHAMMDSKLEIREAGKLALEACIIALPAAMSYVHREDLLGVALNPLNSSASSASILHGAVLTCCVLAETAKEGDNFVPLAWKSVLSVKDKDGLISQACMNFVTIAAQTSKNVFCSEIIHPSMKWLCEAIKREKDQLAGKCLV